MPSETNGTPTDTAELVGELMSCVADLESGTGPDGSHAQIQHPHADLLRRAATALTRCGEAQEIGELVHSQLRQGGDVVKFYRGIGEFLIETTHIENHQCKRDRTCRQPDLISAIRAATTPQTDTKETPNA